MAVAASKVRTVCTTAETALVRASRKPMLEQLSPAQLKQHADRARKLFDKWRDLSRSHARARSGKVGFGESDANTRLKAEIFGDAHQAFTARLAKLESSSTTASKPSGAKTKQQRGVDHRATRAAVRKGMSTVESLLNTPARKPTKKKASPKPTKKSAAAPATKPATSRTKASAPAKAPKTAKSSRPAAAMIPAKSHGTGRTMSAAEQRKANAAAKQSRVTRSGKTTRTLGHVVARGKRAQARRDSKG